MWVKESRISKAALNMRIRKNGMTGSLKWNLKKKKQRRRRS